MRPAVFLDRDGTLLEDWGYLSPVSAPRIFPWTFDALRLLKRAGFALVVVTNQGGIARGLYTPEFVEDTHRRLADRIVASGVVVDDWQYCPHHPKGHAPGWTGPCACRKPEPGMVHAAAARVGALDLARSWVVGDQWRDVQLAAAVGARSVLVRSGHGAEQERTWPAAIAPPTIVCDNLMAAVSPMLALRRP